MIRGDWGENSTNKQMPRVGSSDPWAFCRVCPHLPCLPTLSRNESGIVETSVFFARFFGIIIASETVHRTAFAATLHCLLYMVPSPAFSRRQC